MVTLTFPHSDEDVAYWSAEAAEAHAYSMLCFDLYRSHRRRRKELGLLPDWDYLDEIYRAEAVFQVQYHLALAQRTFVRERLSLADLDS